MKIGLIGIGKMGYNLAQNLLNKGKQLIVHDVHKENMKGLDEKGAEIAANLADLVERLDERKIVYLMVPVGKPVEDTIAALCGMLKKGDIVVDGGNSHYKDTVRRSALLKEKGILYLDCGTSGGVDGALNGVCLMIGGDLDAYKVLEPVFTSIAVEKGCIYTGKSGSGHYCKMIHNGIEYGMMQAMAEGFELMQKSEFEYDLEKVAQVWNNGSVIRSWLMELIENAFKEDKNLSQIKGVMHSTGEGKWSVEEALSSNVCTPVIALSLMMRYRSLEEDTFSGKVVAALRNQFGGHAVEKSNI